ncbi:hypothetical protein ACO2Q7_14930 [Rathayibacter sp. KR2-224]|uniref:hypothetical protein n=1 Tax=Rathayibacter sp. KR2-224 TaxID=3400913 RepID=UPI003C0E4D6C
MASPGSVFDWSTCSRDDFERLVEALLVREAEAEPGLCARAIDGRGGDGGIDVDVRVKKTAELIRIFQLKHFPEGFSGGHRKSRWPQIKNSFNEAMKLNPRTWTLVIPGNGTVQERKSVSALKGTHNVIVRFMGRAELDGLLAKHPDLHDMFTRDAARSALAIVRREQAVPATATDVAAEVRRATAPGERPEPVLGRQHLRPGRGRNACAVR